MPKNNIPKSRKSENIANREKRQKRRLANQARKKKINQVADIKQLKFDLTQSSGELVLNDELVEALEPIEIQKIDSLKEDELVEIPKSVANALTEKIDCLEFHIENIYERLAVSKNESSILEINRDRTKKLLQYDEDVIYHNEQKLDSSDRDDSEYQTDRHYLTRWIMEKITRKPDEFLANSRIAKHEVRRNSRIDNLLKIESQLAGISIIIIHDESLLENLESTVTDYRSERIDMGKSYRDIRRFFKTKQLQNIRSNIMGSLTQTVQNLNNSSNTLKDRVLEAQDTTRRKYVEFDQYQKNLLFPDRGNLLN